MSVPADAFSTARLAVKITGPVFAHEIEALRDQKRKSADAVQATKTAKKANRCQRGVPQRRRIDVQDIQPHRMDDQQLAAAGVGVGNPVMSILTSDQRAGAPNSGPVLNFALMRRGDVSG